MWKGFLRLSRGRPHSAFGQPLPFLYRDVRDEAARVCNDFLSADTVEEIFNDLDDFVLDWAAKNDDRNRRNNK